LSQQHREALLALFAECQGQFPGARQ
jgi:hypothetical protein